MTFSILARDMNSDAIGGAAATGSLCVGGWVLRGDPRAGMSASQGASPSTFWGEDVLAAMRSGQMAEDAVCKVVMADSGRDHRQLSALGLTGDGAAFTGTKNLRENGSIAINGGIVAGNMLTNKDVLRAMAETFEQVTDNLAQRLLTSLNAGHEAGSDMRGLQSAALLIVSPDHAPLTLRVDYHETPLLALEDLYRRATTGDYAEWSRQVPTLTQRERILD
ncbi:MAG: DUF1028 domain-containing protein [Sedimentitalea sp.]|uniref:DUF1028 domain-containing protein n=1 Tax=Sedimentitalea sp. TaxID=2048915 RepID=UPI0032666E55